MILNPEPDFMAVAGRGGAEGGGNTRGGVVMGFDVMRYGMKQAIWQIRVGEYGCIRRDRRAMGVCVRVRLCERWKEKGNRMGWIERSRF